MSFYTPFVSVWFLHASKWKTSYVIDRKLKILVLGMTESAQANKKCLFFFFFRKKFMNINILTFSQQIKFHAIKKIFSTVTCPFLSLSFFYRQTVEHVNWLIIDLNWMFFFFKWSILLNLVVYTLSFVVALISNLTVLFFHLKLPIRLIK